jgi:uncharacterized protein YhaN
MAITTDEAIDYLKRDNAALRQALEPVEQKWRMSLFKHWTESGMDSTVKYADRLSQECDQLRAALAAKDAEIARLRAAVQYALNDVEGRPASWARELERIYRDALEQNSP